MKLQNWLEEQRGAIVERWRDLALEIYAAESVPFYKHTADQFHNPVGHALVSGLEVLFSGVIEDRSPEEVEQALEPIVRIRAVQDLPPSQAVGFVLLLKRAVRELAAQTISGQLPEADLSALDRRIDRLSLKAFDLYMRCREQIFDIRIRDIKLQTPKFFLREGCLEDPPEDGMECSDSCDHSKGGCGA